GTCAVIGDHVVRLDVEFCDGVVETLGASRFERTGELSFDRRLIGGPERAVELVRGDRHTLPPAIAGSRITVESSRTSVSRPSRVRTSSPSTYTLTNGARSSFSTSCGRKAGKRDIKSWSRSRTVSPSAS